MSEYQIVKFRAVDRPLTDKQMQYMDQQSSRAEYNKWQFEVEYHYSSFRGNVDGMLRNGYDIYLNYGSYHGCEVRIRLPNGLPFEKSTYTQYISDEALQWTPDKTGKAGILRIAPYIEEAYDEAVWEFNDYMDALVTVREMLINGDPRALYLLWLCHAQYTIEIAEETLEPPIPHGMDKIPNRATELLSFFDVDPLLIAAAAKGIPSFDAHQSKNDSVKKWLATIADSRRTEIIQRLLVEDPSVLKAELLSEIAESQHAEIWPFTQPQRTLQQLVDNCHTLRKKEDEKRQRQAAARAKREAEKAEKQRQARMAKMKADPQSWLEEASLLVKQRGTDNYREAASILADLREAVGGDQGNKLVRHHAAHLTQEHPTLTKLKSYLRKKQLLD